MHSLKKGNIMKTNEQTTNKSAEAQVKQVYAAPELKEHGHVEDVTLQTFFGTFSPESPRG
jgi:hypothetical protein